MTTFPSSPSDEETSGLGPARPSGHFNYEKQRKGGGEGGLDDGGSGGGGGVFVCVGVLECVYGGTREQEKWKDDSHSMEIF